VIESKPNNSVFPIHFSIWEKKRNGFKIVRYVSQPLRWIKCFAVACVKCDKSGGTHTIHQIIVTVVDVD
jgi:hypothetical protein